jgi:succinoglycan biosynthesis transport protein ExoP
MLFSPARQASGGHQGDIGAGDPAPGARGGPDIPDLRKYWRIVVRWRFVIAGVVLGVVVVGLVASLLMTRQYTATATIEISRQQDRIVQVQDVRPESSFVDQEFYQTQYALLRSRALAERVNRDLKLDRDDRFLSLFGEDEGFFLDSDEDRRPEVAQAERTRKVIKVLMRKIAISPTRGSRLVDVSFTSPDPALSARVANSWTEHFIESNMARRFEATSYARRFLEDRLEKIRQRLEESERLLVAFAARQKIINLPASSGSASGAQSDRPIMVDDLATLNQALSAATADRLRAQSRLSGVSGGATAEGLENVAINQLRQKRGEAQAELARLLAQFQPDYPPAQALREQVARYDVEIAREEARVGSTLRNQYSEAVRRESLLRERVEQLKGNLLDLRRRSIQYNIYQRDVDTNRQLYEGLLQRYKEIGVAGGVGSNNIAIVDVAQVPDRPSSPRLLLNFLLSLVLGLALAALVTFALEQIDEAIKDPEELTRETGLPLLGAVPRSQISPLEELKDRKSPTSEAYLSLQTNLQFSSDHGVPRSLAVTSTRPAEGKSTTSYAVAASLARTGRSVILIDGDMRSPSVHNLIGIENGEGLSSFLAGSDDLHRLIIPMAEPNLFAITAGANPPNAAELLTSQRLQLMIDRLLESYDNVVIDSPPVVGLADAPLIASRVEAVVFAVESRGVRSSMIRTALARLRAANANVIGGVLTKFDPKRAHYGYGYDYGYGYGADEAKAG